MKYFYMFPLMFFLLAPITVVHAVRCYNAPMAILGMLSPLYIIGATYDHFAFGHQCGGANG